MQMTVQSRTKEETLLGKWNVVYEGALQDAEFTVPADARWIRFVIKGDAGTSLNALTLSDGTKLPMDYKFLPDAIVGRLQDGMLRGQNFQQRLQYVRDSWKIFKQSPLVGHGYGSTEYLYVTVQPYFYESLFAHNHILQIMDDMGLLGLAAFLLLSCGALFVLIRRRVKVQDSLAAALIACWAMMNFHSLMEINFSVRMYQCAAYFLLMIVAVAFEQPMPKNWRKIHIVS